MTIRILLESIFILNVLFLSVTSLAESSVTNISLKNFVPENTLRNKFEWKTSLSAESYKEGINKEVGTSTDFRIKLQKLITENIYLKFEGGIGYSTDNVQLSLSEFYSDNFFNAQEATINFALGKNILLSAGNISQGYLNSGILISGKRSFPGLKQEFFVESDKNKFGFIAQQSIPTSKAFNIDRQKKEAVPSFLVGTLYADLDIKYPLNHLPTTRLKWNTGLSFFEFENLPSVVASRGQFYGHNPVGSKSTSRFLYEFSGFLVNSELKIEDQNNYEFGINAYWADNLKAKYFDRLESITYFASKSIKNVNMKISYEDFFKDREASPAVYSSNGHGRNNREGQVYGLDVEFSDYNFKLEAKYYDLDVLAFNGINQSERTNYYLGVETLYVEF